MPVGVIEFAINLDVVGISHHANFRNRPPFLAQLPGFHSKPVEKVIDQRKTLADDTRGVCFCLSICEKFQRLVGDRLLALHRFPILLAVGEKGPHFLFGRTVKEPAVFVKHGITRSFLSTPITAGREVNHEVIEPDIGVEVFSGGQPDIFAHGDSFGGVDCRGESARGE